MKNIIVREYLQSLKEDGELDAIFPILLEVMEFQIITSPKYTKGYQQFGKDVVAIGIDPVDSVKKRFYFEVKGESDKNITPHSYNKADGIKESINEAKDRPFKHSSDPTFNTLPVKIVLVHNGILTEAVRETFNGFIEREFPGNNSLIKSKLPKFISKWFAKNIPVESFEFERWDIYKLTELFTTKLFNEYLLTDDESVQLFKKVLVLLNTPRNDNSDFRELISRIFVKAGKYSDLGKRGRLLLAETLKLISFIVYSYGKSAGHLEQARQCLNFALLAYWYWLLENKVENDAVAIRNFKKFLSTYKALLDEFYVKTLPVAMLKNGLWSPSGGRYEQVGYPVRSLSYMGYLVAYYDLLNDAGEDGDISVENQTDNLHLLINNNSGCHRPLLDNHSIPIIATVDFFIRKGKDDYARELVAKTWSSIIKGYDAFNRLPDASNSIKNVSKFMITHQKGIYFNDKTSHLMGALLEYLVLLDMESDYQKVQKFLTEVNIHLAVFVPYADLLLEQMEYSIKNHEMCLFSKTIEREGYQSEINFKHGFNEFKAKIMSKNEFEYQYRTTNSGFGFLTTLAHVYFKTPLFPNVWRSRIN